MTLLKAMNATITSKKFWLWAVAGIVIYLIPVAIRFATKSVAIPILNFPGFWIDHLIPGNFLEKLLVNSFFPGGVGGVAGEIFASNLNNRALKGRDKYMSRLTGALSLTLVWSAFQYWGYTLMIFGPYGSNIFEHAIVFPINFVLAAISIFTPDLVNFAVSELRKVKNFAKKDSLDF